MSFDPTSTASSRDPSIAVSSDSGSQDELQSSDQLERSFQIFLGGSCNPTTWRQSVAIPYLEKNGVTYYNPQVENWTEELVTKERHAKHSAQVLLFVLDEQTRSTVSLVESAFMAGAGKRLVLVIYPFEYDVLSLTDTTKQTNIVETRSELTKTTSRKSTSPNRKDFTSSVLQSSSTSSSRTISSTFKHASGTIKINGEIISIDEFHELRQARYILQNLVDRRNTAMFSDIPQALDYVIKCLVNDKTIKDNELCTKNTSANKDQELELSKSDSDIKPPENASKERAVSRAPTQDVCLMLDDSDDKSIVSSLMLLLRERVLSYSYRPLTQIINDGQLYRDTLPLTHKQTLSLTNSNNAEETNRSTTLASLKGEQLVKLSLDGEMDTIQSSRVLLLVITNKCRGLSIMVLASYFVALFRENTVLCIQYLEEPCSINGEVLSRNAIADYNRARVYLCDYAMKSQVPVFKTIEEAIDCCSQKCQIKNIKD